MITERGATELVVSCEEIIRIVADLPMLVVVGGSQLDWFMPVTDPGRRATGR